MQLPWKGLRKGLKRLRAGKRQARTSLKTDGWGMWLRELLPVALACGVRMPLLPWQATKEPSSTPPVVPGAAPASAKAGVGGYIGGHQEPFDFQGRIKIRARCK